MPEQRAHTRRLYECLYREACDIVGREYAAPLELAAIARRIATSRRQLQRAFAQAGTTFQAELTRSRMEHAAELLELRSLRIRDVAARVGYRQPSQFAKAFRRQYGVTPAHFRDQHAPDWGMALRSLSHVHPAVAGSGAFGSQPLAAAG